MFEPIPCNSKCIQEKYAANVHIYIDPALNCVLQPGLLFEGGEIKESKSEPPMRLENGNVKKTVLFK